MLKYVRDRLAGGFDLVFLFGRGIEKFDGTKREAMLSLILPSALFFLSLYLSRFYPPKGMTAVPHSRAMELMTAHDVLSFILGNLLVAGLAKSLGVLDRFWLYFSSSNWVGISFSILTLPLAIAAVTHYAPRAPLDRAFVLVDVYGYIVTACVVWRSFRVNWELAGFITIASLFVDQELWHLIYHLQGLPWPWSWSW